MDAFSCFIFHLRMWVRQFHFLTRYLRMAITQMWFALVFCFELRGHTAALFNIVFREHYDDVIMGTIASQITSLTIVYSNVYSGADQSKHQSSASLAFVWGIHRGPVNSPHKCPVTRKMFPFDDVIMSAKVKRHDNNSSSIQWHGRHPPKENLN